MGKTAEELRWEIDQRRADLTRDLDAIGDKVSPGRMVERRTEAVKGRVRGARETIMGRADAIGGQTSDKADAVKSSVSDVAHSAQEGVHTATEKIGEVPGMVTQGTQGNPLAVGLVAFGLGLLAATVLPESRRERRLARKVQPSLEDAARTAAETGRSLADDVRPVLEESAAHVQDSAKESVQNVTGHAKDAAHSVADESKEAAANVKQAAQS